MSKLNEIIKFPKYQIHLPVSEQEKYFRPFTVREESTILLAKQTENFTVLLKNLIDVMSVCFNEDVSTYCLADFEYAFLKFREKSIGEVETFSFKCPETQETVNASVNLLEHIAIDKNETKNRLQLDDSIIIEFISPTIKEVLEVPDYKKNPNSSIKFIAKCIKKIQNKKEILTSEELNLEELEEFLYNLTKKQFKQILEYFENQSKIYVILHYITSDGQKRIAKINGITPLINFFFDHITLHTFFTLMFQMKYYHNYSIDEYYEMLPWQRQVLIKLITIELEKEKNNQEHQSVEFLQ
jgi:hypothetical protein